MDGWGFASFQVARVHGSGTPSLRQRLRGCHWPPLSLREAVGLEGRRLGLGLKSVVGLGPPLCSMLSGKVTHAERSSHLAALPAGQETACIRLVTPPSQWEVRAFVVARAPSWAALFRKRGTL